MLSASDDTDPEQAYTSSRVLRSQNERRNLEFNASSPVSLVKVPRCPYDGIRPLGACCLQMDELAHFQERELQDLMIASLDGDAGAYHHLLEQLTLHLRAYYGQRFARIGHGPAEAEDLLQEALIAIHTHRQTYDRSRPFTHLDPCHRSIQISRRPRDRLRAGRKAVYSARETVIDMPTAWSNSRSGAVQS